MKQLTLPVFRLRGLRGITASASVCNLSLAGILLACISVAWPSLVAAQSCNKAPPPVVTCQTPTASTPRSVTCAGLSSINGSFESGQVITVTGGSCTLDNKVRINVDNIILRGNGITLSPGTDGMTGFDIAGNDILLEGFTLISTSMKKFKVGVVLDKTESLAMSRYSTWQSRMPPTSPEL